MAALLVAAGARDQPAAVRQPVRRALLLGLLVGYERSYHNRAAGMRTYGIVCMASCALTVFAGYPGFLVGQADTSHLPIDPTGWCRGIVTGIGFLGAGVIMRDGLASAA